MLAFRHLGQSHQLETGGFYNGAPPQLYADTPAAKLKGIVAEIEAGAPWTEVIDRHYREAQPWLHRIIRDPSRNTFFREVVAPRGAEILDVGAGWGQQTLELGRHNTVCAVEPNPDRLAFIRAAARQEQVAATHYLAANFQDLEFESRFDLATCIGVLEWVGTYSPLPDPREAQRQFLRRFHGALKPGGRLVIGIENRVGLKYLMHAPDDHIGVPDIACLPYEQANRLWRQRSGADLRVITYSEPEYRRLLSECGFAQASFFAAYPDYKLARVVLPCDPPDRLNRYFLDGGFEPEHDGHTGSPLAFQEELAAQYRTFAELGLAAAVAPSYFIVATK